MEVLRAWEAENLRLRTQVVKLMEQQVKSAALEAKAHQNDMLWQKEKAALVRQLKGNNKQNVQRRLHLTNSHKSLREEKRRLLEERESSVQLLEENDSEMNQLRIQLQQLEVSACTSSPASPPKYHSTPLALQEEHQHTLQEKDAVNAENLKFRATVAELEAEVSGLTAQMIREQKEAPCLLSPLNCQVG